jgi:endogenous inhibitor of DNA gyrase (YacG/DUF329 family)
MCAQDRRAADGGKTIEFPCPQCGTVVVYREGDEEGYFPFCSERCRLIDLGKWIDGEHRISRSPEGDDWLPPEQ